MYQPWSTLTRILVTFIVLALLVFLAVEMRSLLTPLILAALLAYILNLGVRFLDRRTRLKYRSAVFIVYFIFLTIIIAMPGTLVPIVVRQAQTITLEFNEINRQIEAFVTTPIVILGQTIPLAELWTDLTSITTDFGSAFDSAVAVVETTSINLLRLVIILVVSFYLLKDWRELRKWLVNLLPPNGQGDALRLLSEIDLVWRAYMQGTLALMIIVAVLFIIIGLAIGLRGAVAVGLLTGFLSMIPELGPWIAGIIAILIAFFAGSNHLPLSNFWFAVLVAGIYLVLTQVKSIWLRPQVMGRFMRMNTGLVFLAIIAAAMLQGILAALVILPILATVGVIGRYVRARLLNLDPWKTEDQQDAVAMFEPDQPDNSPSSE